MIPSARVNERGQASYTSLSPVLSWQADTMIVQIGDLIPYSRTSVVESIAGNLAGVSCYGNPAPYPVSRFPATYSMHPETGSASARPEARPLRFTQETEHGECIYVSLLMYVLCVL